MTVSSSALRIAILEADTPMERTAAKYGTYGTVFSLLLRSAASALGWDPDASLDITKYDVVRAGMYPPSLEAIDAVLITGSKANAFDDTPWIGRLVEFTREILVGDGSSGEERKEERRRRVRVIGVCFGHQIIARALGVEVVRNDRWEASVCQVPLNEEGKKLFEGLETLNIFQMHRDIVPSLPNGLQNLGSTETCQIQGLHDPGRLISVQGHPEFNQEIVEEILQKRRDAGIFTQKDFEEYWTRVGDKQDGVVVAKAFLRFLRE